MKVKCLFCEKMIDAKVITRWRKKTGREWYSDGIDGDVERWIPTFTSYRRVKVFNHNRGIIKKHKCKGSGSLKVLRG